MELGPAATRSFLLAKASRKKDFVESEMERDLSTQLENVILKQKGYDRMGLNRNFVNQ